MLTESHNCEEYRHSEKVKVKATITGARHKVKQKLGPQEWVRFGSEENITGRADQAENERKGLEVLVPKLPCTPADAGRQGAGSRKAHGLCLRGRESPRSRVRASSVKGRARVQPRSDR